MFRRKYAPNLKQEDSVDVFCRNRGYYGEGWEGFKNWYKCGGREVIALGVIISFGAILFAMHSSGKSKATRQNLITKLEQKADINHNGTLEPEEIGNVYQTLNIPFYEGLTFRDMENYLEKTKQQDL